MISKFSKHRYLTALKFLTNNSYLGKELDQHQVVLSSVYSTRLRLDSAGTIKKSSVFILKRWVKYWVCLSAVVTTMRIPLLSSLLLQLPYFHYIYITIFVWLVVPLIHGTHVVYSFIRVSTIGNSVAHHSTPNFLRLVIERVAHLWNTLHPFVPPIIQRFITAAHALINDPLMFIIAVAAIFVPRFITELGITLISYVYAAYRTIQTLDQCISPEEPVSRDRSQNGNPVSPRNTIQISRQIQNDLLKLLGWLKYWIVLMFFEAIWWLLTFATSDLIPFWSTIHLCLSIILLLPSLGISTYLYNEFRASPVAASYRIPQMIKHLLDRCISL